MSDRLLGTLFVIGSSTAFGAMAIFGVWAQDDGTDTMALVFFRFALASVVLIGAARLRGLVLPPLRRWWPVAAMGGIGYVGQASCYFLGLQYAQASLVALLLYLFPAFVTVLAVVFLRERPGVVMVAALAMSLAGTALVVGGGSGRPLGIALGIGAAMIYSVYIVIGSVVTHGLDPVFVSTVVCCAAAVVTGLILVVLALAGHRQSFPNHARGWGSLVAIAVVCTAFAVLAFFAGLARLGPTATSVLSTVEPVVTVVLAAALLDERLSGVQAIGGALVLAAVVWLAVVQRRPVAAVETPPI
jgi:drug/metabolite transporter (DMT)-like permease